MLQIAVLAGVLGVALHAIGFFVFRVSPPEAKAPDQAKPQAQVIWSYPLPDGTESMAGWKEWLILLNPKPLYFAHLMASESHHTPGGFDIIDLFPAFHPDPVLEWEDFGFQPGHLPEQRFTHPDPVSPYRHEALIREFGTTRQLLPPSESSPLSFHIDQLDSGRRIATGKLSIPSDALPGTLWSLLSFNLTVVAEISSLPFFKINSSGDSDFDQTVMEAFKEHPKFKSLSPGNYRVTIFP